VPDVESAVLPVVDKVTVTIFAEAVFNVTVTIVLVAPNFSLIVKLPTDNVAVGGTVPSTIVTVTCCVVASVQVESQVMSTTIVSSASSNGSSLTAVSVTEAVVVPAGIVIVEFNAKSVDVTEPEVVNVTTTALAEIVFNVAVTDVLVGVVFSLMLVLVAPPTVNVTVGGTVSSTIVTVCGVLVPDFVQVVSHVKSMMTVSFASSNKSSFAERVAAPARLPAGIVIVVELNKKSVDVAVLVATVINVTVTNFADTKFNVAVTVVLVPAVFSLILVAPLIDSVTVGGAVSSTIVTVL
jgi:hypothetical protein